MNISFIEKMEESRRRYRNLMIFIMVFVDFCAIYVMGDALSKVDSLTSAIPAIIFILLNVGIVAIYYWTGARLSRMIKKSGMTEAQLELEFQNARELIIDKAYIGEQYFFFMDEMFTGLLKIDDIVWVCSRVHYAGRYFNQRLIYLYIYTVDHKKYCIYCDDADAVVAYFLRNVPHVIVGERWELSKMYWFDFRGFLDLKYNKNGSVEK